MRSVQLFPAIGLSDLTALLDSVGQRSGDECFDIADRRVEAASAALSQSRPWWTNSSVRASSRLRWTAIVGPVMLSALWVEVRISGRGEYQAEMLELAERILAAGSCGADGYSDGLWSLGEIRTGRADGARFRA